MLRVKPAAEKESVKEQSSLVSPVPPGYRKGDTKLLTAFLSMFTMLVGDGGKMVNGSDEVGASDDDSVSSILREEGG